MSNRFWLLELGMEDMELSSEQFIILIMLLSRSFIQRKRLRGKGKSHFINLNRLLMKTSFDLLLPITVITVPRIVSRIINFYWNCQDGFEHLKRLNCGWLWIIMNGGHYLIIWLKIHLHLSYVLKWHILLLVVSSIYTKDWFINYES